MRIVIFSLVFATLTSWGNVSNAATDCETVIECVREARELVERLEKT